jgi:hypothetical protein
LARKSAGSRELSGPEKTRPPDIRRALESGGEGNRRIGPAGEHWPAQSSQMQSGRPVGGPTFDRDPIRYKRHCAVVRTAFSFIGTRFENARRITPQRLGKGVAQISAGQAHIREHVCVEAGKNSCLATMPENVGEPSSVGEN